MFSSDGRNFFWEGIKREVKFSFLRLKVRGEKEGLGYLMVRSMG